MSKHISETWPSGALFCRHCQEQWPCEVERLRADFIESARLLGEKAEEVVRLRAELPGIRAAEWHDGYSKSSADYTAEIERLQAEVALLDENGRRILGRAERADQENERLRARVKELETGIRKFLDPTGPEAFGLERLPLDEAKERNP